ncbi:MAG: SUF system Fe-S cluster assembly regulator [Acidobacteriota bacterium]
MLRLTKQADYGIVLLAYLAQHPDRRHAASGLADESGLPQPTVAKILKILTRADLLDSHRGAKGGYSLAVTPRELSVARMIEVLDGPIAFTDCVDESPGECSQEAGCRLRAGWQAINVVIRNALDSVSLADLLAEAPVPATSTPRLVQLTSRRADELRRTEDFRSSLAATLDSSQHDGLESHVPQSTETP